MKTRLVFSALRTAIAVGFLGLGVKGVLIGVSWPNWCPNNDAGIILVLAVYIVSLILILSGIYQISPILWKSLEPAVFGSLFGINRTEREWEEYEKEMQELQDVYLW